MKYLHRIVQKSAFFAILLCSCMMLNFSAFAYDDAECFGESNGTPYPTGELGLVTTDIPIDEDYLANTWTSITEGVNTFDANVLYKSIGGQGTWNNIINPNGVISCTNQSNCTLPEMKQAGDRDKLDTQLHYYLAGQSWSVTFPGKGTVRGYAYCAPAGWSNAKSTDMTVKTGAPATTYNGCSCTITDLFDHSVLVADFRFITHKQVFDGSNWVDKANNCRKNCPSICAERVATESAFRQKLFQSCPVFESGGDDPEPVPCNDGEYLPANSNTCSACTGEYYCTANTYTPSSQPQGLNTCEFGYEPNSAHTACVKKMVECDDGEYLPANSLTCTACTDNFYCEADIYEFDTTQNQGLLTCSAGMEPNAAHTGCVTAKIHCDAGYYLPGGQTTCSACTGDYYCEEGNYDPSGADQGLQTCDFGYEPNSAHDSCSAKLVECNDGEYLPANSLTCSPCTGNYYCEADIYEFSGQAQGLKTCLFGSEPTYDHTGCELRQIHCNDGYYLPQNSVSCAACIGFEYCPEHTWSFSTESDQGKATCAAGSLPDANHTSCTPTKFTCPEGKYLPSYSSSEYDCQYCPDPYEVGEYYYCPGGEYDANAPIDAGMIVCPEYSHSEEESSYCTCNEGYTTDGKVANSSNTRTTTDACLPENSAPFVASYVCDAGQEVALSGNVISGSTFTFIYPDDASCSKTGYTFAGWSDGTSSARYFGGDTITWNYDADTTFTATWEQIPVYQVSYSCGNEATGGYAPSADDVTYHTSYTFKENTCVRTGYDFLGWDYNNQDLYGEGDTINYSYNSDIQVVPMWSAKTIHCEAGYYAPAGTESCNSLCLANSYCEGGNYTYTGQNLGINSCSAGLPAWATSYAHSTSGSDEASDCHIELVAGTYAEDDGLHDCAEGFYCSGYNGSVAQFVSLLNEQGMVGITDCSEAPAYADWSWTHGITSNENSTSMYDCKIVVAPATYMDENGAIQECVEDFYCPGKVYSYTDTETFFTELFEYGAGVYECPENTSTNASMTSCDCSNGFVLNPNTSTCVESCGAGLYMPANASACIEVGAGYYSPLSDQNRYSCPTGLTTTGSGVGADELGDCGRILHIAGQSMRLRSVKKTTPSLNIKINGSTYYGSMTTTPTTMNATTDKKLHIKYDGTTRYVYDTTID